MAGQGDSRGKTTCSEEILLNKKVYMFMMFRIHKREATEIAWGGATVGGF